MRKSKKKIVYNCILVIALVVFLFSLFKVGTTLYKYYLQDQEKDKMVEVANLPKDIEKEPFTIDWKKLQEINPEICAWILLPDTNISYAITQGSDNTYYLTHTAENKELYSGAIFLDASAHKDFSDRNTIIYGHNVLYGTMFAQLEKFKEEDFFNKHPYVYIFTPEKSYRCEVLSFYTTTDVSPSYQTVFTSDEEYSAYLDQIQAQSLYPGKSEITTSDSMITLSTCSYEAGEASDLRYLLQAKVVPYEGKYMVEKK